MDIELTDHSEEVLEAMREGVTAALEAVGNQAVSHAKSNITRAGRVDTGALRNSMSHLVQGDTVYVGTNNEYAIYNELGTGIYLEGGGGRQTPWHYVDAKGKGHWTHGMKPIHFLKNAVTEHISEYNAIVQKILRGN